MFNSHFQRTYCIGIGVSIGLIALGWILAPKESLTGVIAAATILVVYGLTAQFVVKKISSGVLSNATRFGLIAGLIFTTEIVLEYILLPKDNTLYGLVEFGSVFLIYFLASIVTAYQTRHIRNGVFSSVGSAMIATLVWTIATLSVFYLFYGTPQQTLVFQAEGNYADFAQSGMNNFNTFVIEDFMGAIFFHSLLGPIVAMVLGFTGGAIGKGIARLRSH